MDERFGPEALRTKINDSIESIENFECKKILSNLRFYDFQAMNSIIGIDLVVRYKCPDLLRFGDITIGNCSLESYEKVEEQLMTFFVKLVRAIPDEICYVTKYDEKWVVDNKLCAPLANLLASKRITNAYNAIRAGKNSNIIELFARSCFRYNSFVQFVFPETQLIISPTDHLDIFCSSPSGKKLRELLTEVLSTCGYKSLEIGAISNN